MESRCALSQVSSSFLFLLASVGPPLVLDWIFVSTITTNVHMFASLTHSMMAFGDAFGIQLVFDEVSRVESS